MSAYIFIVGCSRSGTTLLRDALSAHPDTALALETHFFSKLAHKGVLRSVAHLFPFDSDEKFRELKRIFKSGNIFGMIWREDWDTDFDTDQLVDDFAMTQRTEKDLFEQIILNFAKLRGKKRAGEKTPSHLYHVDKLVEWFPDCRVIHLLRDPRAILLSEVHKRSKPDYFLKKENPLYSTGLFFWVVSSWWLAIRTHERYQRLYPENYKLIKFEDMIRDSENTFKTICDFVDLDDTGTMLKLPKKVNTSFDGDPTHDPLIRWKEKLPKSNIALMNRLLRKELTQFGYPL